MARAIWILSWPILVESLLNAFVGLTDTVLAAGIDPGRHAGLDGVQATDAVSGAAYLLWVITLVVQALGVGASALIARAVGAGRFGAANGTVGQVLSLCAVSGVVVGVLMALAAGPTASLLSLQPGAASAFREYIWINSLGVPLHSLLFGGIACARGAGDSIRPLLAMIAVNIVNPIASFALAGVDLTRTSLVAGEHVTRTILRNPLEFNWGVKGIAAGTLAGYLAGAVIIVWALSRGVGGVRLRARWLVPHRPTLLRVMGLAMPNFLETFGMWAGNFLLILVVGWIGISTPGALGAHFIAIRVEAFSFLAGMALGTAAATLGGQFLGAGSPEHARRAVWTCAGLAALVMGLCGVAYMAWPRALVGMLSSQEPHLQLTPALLFITGTIQVPFAVANVLRAALRGVGDVRAAMWIVWISTYAMRLPLAYLMSGVDIRLGSRVIENPSPLDWGLPGLWIALCTEIVLRSVMFVWRFARGGWSRARF